MGIFTRYKKIFLIIIFLAVVALLGYLLWKVFFSVKPPVTSTPITNITTTGGLPAVGPGGEAGEETGGSGKLPGEENQPGAIVGNPDPEASAPDEIASGRITQTSTVTKSAVLNPTLSSNGGVQYYDKNDGLFYKIDENGNVVKLSDKVFYQVDKVFWAPDKDRAILEYPDGSKIMYNFATDKQVTLPNYWKDFSFADNSDQIVAKSIGLDPDNRWLIVSGSDGSKATALEPIGTKDATVYPSWSPNNQIVAMYTRGVDFDRQEIFFVGLNGENFKSTVIEGRGLQSQWSTAGDKLLYSVYHTRDDLKPRLWIVDANGDNIGGDRHSFNLQTWADKCTFASNTEIYCAVPENLEAGAGMFPELADKTKDSLYKIDLTTGTQKLIAIPNGAYNISQIMVPDNQGYIYFTDKNTELIYKIKM
jgi:hypothetical protein